MTLEEFANLLDELKCELERLNENLEALHSLESPEAAA